MELDASRFAKGSAHRLRWLANQVQDGHILPAQQVQFVAHAGKVHVSWSQRRFPQDTAEQKLANDGDVIAGQFTHEQRGQIATALEVVKDLNQAAQVDGVLGQAPPR